MFPKCSKCILLIFIHVSILFAYEFNPDIDCKIIVKTNNGSYKGCQQYVGTDSLFNPSEPYRRIFTFKGIPYAKPPVDELRFERPQPLTYYRMTEVDAKDFKSSCKQPLFYSSGVKNFWQSSEDCLHLNIFTPSLNKYANLSVMFYIHDGGFVFGSAREVPAEQLSLRDVVVVTINYRLGVLGFMCTDHDEAPGNMGLWDQAMALNWVKRNIKVFGGNPDDITLFGHSAGAVSVSSHVVSDVSRKYFNRAIIQSGSSLTNIWLRSKEYSTRVAKRFAKFVGCSPESNYIQCLREKSANTLIAAQTAAFLWNMNTSDAQPWYSAMFLEFVQCYGDDFLPQNVFELLETGNYNKDIRVLIGHNALESAQFTYIYDLLRARFGALSPQIPDAVVNARIARYDIQKIMIGNESFSEQVAEQYTKTFDDLFILTPLRFFDRQRLRAAVVHSYSDYSLVCPTVLFGKYLTQRPDFTGKVFQYYLSYANSQSVCRLSTWCANTNYDDIPLVFGNPFFENGYSDMDRNMSTVMMDIFTEFAKTNEAPLVNGHDWPAYSRNGTEVSANYLELNPNSLGQTYENRYIGNNGFVPTVIQNCQFWQPILRSLF